MKKSKGMQGKVISVFFGITAVLIVFIFTIFTQLIFKNENQKYMESAGKRIEAISFNINRVLSSVLDRSNAISESLLLQEIIMTEESDSGFFEEYIFLNKFFHGYKEYENYIEGQYCIYPVNEKFPENAYITKLEKLKKSEIWESIKDMSEEEVIWIFFDNPDESYFSVFKKITYGVNKNLGVFEIKIPFSQIAGILNSAERAEGELMLLTTPDGKVIYENGGSREFANDIVFRERLVTGHELVLSASMKYIYSTGYIYLFIAFISMIILLFFCYFLYYFITDRLMRPFSNFVKSIENDENILLNPELIEDEGDRDMLKIVVKFKEMAHKINKMYRDIEIINKEKKKAELEVMQTSLNPHLLYNSLSVLKWRLSDKNDTEMMNLIDFMVEYYRSALADGRLIITVDEEIKLVKGYLQIVKIAYNKEFEQIVEVSEDVGECCVLKQILQPVVENAVMHGLKSGQNAKLEIYACKEGTNIVFTVKDNGCGMEQEKIDLVLSGSFDGNGKKHSGYGLKNICARIKAYYGKDAGISIESEIGKGTCVKMIIKELDEK